jgi:enediyne biosynthesis protein E4
MTRLSRRQLLQLLSAAIPGLAAPLPAYSPPAAPAAARPWFTDVAPRSTFSYRTNNDFTGRKYFPQPMCGGVAALDYDTDGWMDLFFTNGARLPDLKKASPAFMNCLLRNKHDGTFEDVTAQAGLDGKDLGFCFGVAAADYDNDGRPDLFLCNAGRNALYHNNGDGTFTDVTSGSGLDQKPEHLLSVGAAWFDYDNDGRLDLLVTNYTTWSPDTDKRCQMDEHRDEYCSPTVYKSVAARLYRNLGNGKFQDVTDASGIGKSMGKGMGIAIADFNGDGWPDIFIANDTEPNFLFINQRNGTFTETGIEYGAAYNSRGESVSGMGCDAKDFDNDGLVDIVYNDLAGQVFGLLRNEGGKSFADITWTSRMGALSRSLSGWSIGFIDFDNDGWKDIYSANGDVDDLTAHSRQHDTMFQNIDGKTLTDATEQMGPDFKTLGYQRGSAFVDLNNDGSMDLVVTSLGERPRILINNALTRNHWIMFRLRGHKSNRDGIGARIKVLTASGRALFNHVTTSIGFMSSSDLRVHFGLGSESKLDYAEVRWPSGIVQRLDRPAPDRILTVEEPPQ